METAKRQGLREKILKYIPIYGHYKLQEEKREWDRSIRDEATSLMTEAEKTLIDMLGDAVSKRDRITISQIEKSRKSIHLLDERIKTTPLGYFPCFSPIKVDDKALIGVLDLDEQLVSGAIVIRNKIVAIMGRFRKGEGKEALLALEEVEKDLQGLDLLLGRRSKILRTGILDEMKE